MLLLLLEPLLPQTIDHLVVDPDQGIHLRLPHLAELGGKVALADQLRPGADQVQGDEEGPHQQHAEDDREDEQPFDRQQPGRVLAQDEERDRRENRVDQDQIDDDLGPQAHAGTQCDSSPYFSKRR